MTITIRWADDALNKFGEKLVRLQRDFPKVLPREINKVGNLAKTQVVRALTAQTGLPRKTIVKAIGNPNRAKVGKLSYEMVTRGGKIRLKYLNPKETRKGVVAKPFGQPRLYAGAFLKGGWWPDRKAVAKFDGHVWRRNGSGRHITQQRSDVVIPNEMSSGNTLAAFNRVAGPMLVERIDKVIKKLAP